MHSYLNVWVFMLRQSHTDWTAVHHPHLGKDDLILARRCPGPGCGGSSHASFYITECPKSVIRAPRVIDGSTNLFLKSGETPTI